MMITIQAGKRALGVCLLLLLVASCSREQQDWRAAESADTIESYGHFIQRHPESELTTEARTRVAQLGEDKDWQRAGSADTADAYRQFITQHPNGKWTQEARIRVDNFSLGAQGAANASAGMNVSATATAAATPAAAGSGSSSPAGTFGIQLGAFSTEASAANQWRSLSAQFADELRGLSERVVTADTPSGRIYRLQAMGGDESRARATCDALRKRSQGCVPVLPH